MDFDALRNLYQSLGEKRFAVRVVNLINEGKIKAEDFSLRGLWECLGQPNLRRDIFVSQAKISEAVFKEAMDSTAFPMITGALISKVVQDAYAREDDFADSLVRTIPSSVKDETIVGFTAADGLEAVEELVDYTEGEVGEKYHKIWNQKYGRLLALSEEMVKFDQTGQLVYRANQLGELARVTKTSIIMKAILGYTNAGVQAAWRPKGTATTLYSATSADPFSTGTFDCLIADNLADETDLDAALVKLSAAKDEKGNPISAEATELLVSPSRRSIAEKLYGSQGTVIASYSSGVKNPMQNRFRPIATSWVTNLRGATYWALGAFRKQFVYTEVFPLQTFQAKPGNEQEFKRDAAYCWKARLMGGCGALTNRYVILSSGGS